MQTEMSEIEFDVDPGVKILWRQMIQSGEIGEDDILSVTLKKGESVFALVEYVDSLYRGILQEWASACVGEVRSYIELRLARIPNADAVLGNPLGIFNTCEPEAARALVFRRFRSAFPHETLAYLRYALQAQIYLGCRAYGEAVEHAKRAWCHKEMPGFDRALAHGRQRAIDLADAAEEGVAKVLLPLLRRRLKLNY